jgi:hypothetical protein
MNIKVNAVMKKHRMQLENIRTPVWSTPLNYRLCYNEVHVEFIKCKFQPNCFFFTTQVYNKSSDVALRICMCVSV